MSVVCVLCNILILASIVRVWAPSVAFPACGAHPHYAIRSITFLVNQALGAQPLHMTIL